eukprot:COSAG01_NODE_55491_length_324_cov_1.920000_1_plen_22_part_01
MCRVRSGDNTEVRRLSAIVYLL